MTKKNTFGSNMLTGAQVCQELSDLSNAHANWKNGSYKKSNDELYAILDRCLSLYVSISVMSEGKRKVIKEIDAALALDGVRPRKNTSLVTKIVRLVFGDCGKRAFAYARVILTAASDKHESQSMSAFITSRGGIEEVRKAGNGQSSSKEQREQLIENAENRIANAAPLISGIKLVDEIQPDDDTGLELVAVLLRKEPDGTGSIVYGCNSTTVINSLLAVSERDAIAASKNAVAAAQPAQAAKARAAVIQQAAA